MSLFHIVVCVVAGGSLVTSSLHAQQHTILFAVDSDQFTLDLGNGLLSVGTCAEGEVCSVTPADAAYSARPFLTQAGQWSLIGDADGDGRFVDSSTMAPGGAVDCVFVRAVDVGPFSSGDVFVSKDSIDGLPPGVEDGDVFRYASGGMVEVFVSEAELLIATGASATLDTDAMCQSAVGDLFFSVSTGVAGFDDGDLIYIPASAITYANGNVAAIAPGSAVRLASEAELELLIGASGFRNATGGAASTVFDLSALEIDPAGGTWTPLSSGIMVPNLLFAWNGFTNDGGVISTANGGSIAMVNGVPLASTIATQGLQLGLLPDSAGIDGLGGLALIPAQSPRIVVENYPSDLVSGSGTGPTWHRVELAGVTPNGVAVAFVAVGPPGPGGAVATVPAFGGDFFVGSTFFLIGPVLTDALGYGEFNFLLEANSNLPGVNVVFEVIDATTAKVSAGAALQFL